MDKAAGGAQGSRWETRGPGEVPGEAEGRGAEEDLGLAGPCQGPGNLVQSWSPGHRGAHERAPRARAPLPGKGAG